MARKFNSVFRNQDLKFAQKGAVLIFLAFVLGLGAAAYMLKAFNTSSLQAKQDEKTYEALGEAKQALLAWAVSHSNTPGLMPYPDRNGDGNYDDTSDCYAPNINFAPDFTLGRLPLFKSDPNCINSKSTVGLGLADDFRDGAGERLWFEVSRNLLHDYKSSVPNPDGVSPIINPSIVNTPTYPWFVVRDRTGVVISDRVAAVIISPGAPLGNQDRSGGTEDADQYLDEVVMASGTSYKNYGYQDIATNPVQEFIIGDDSRNVAANDPTYTQPYNFNDKLVFITIDELMAALEKRAANEIENALLNYFDPASASRPNGRGIGYFPYAARLGSSKDYACITSNNAGVLPIGTVAPVDFTCNYNRGGGVTTASCTTGFSDINSISHRRNNNYTARTGACSFSGRVCTCTGAGSCTRGAQSFTCDAAGSCITTSNGAVTFSGGEFTANTNRCSLSCVDATCSGNGSGSASRVSCGDAVFNTGGSSLPAWIMTNKWYDYFYYANSETGRGPIVVKPLTVGARSNIDALLIGTGRPIIAPNIAASKGANQIRSSCSLNDHLDSIENTNANLVFDAITLPRTQNYNDHSYIVAP